MRILSYLKIVLSSVIIVFLSFTFVNAKTVIRTDEACYW